MDGAGYGHIRFYRRMWFGNDLVDVTWQIRDRVKGQSLIHRFKNLSSRHILGFLGSIVIGSKGCEGSTSPTLPKTLREPLRTLSIIVSVMNPSNEAQDLELGNIFLGAKLLS